MVATTVAGLCFILCADLAAAAPGTAGPKAKLGQVRQAIAQHQNKRQALDRRAAALADQVGKLRAETVRLADKITAAEAAVYLAGLKLRHIVAEADGAKARLESRRTELAETLDALLRLSRAPSSALLMSPQGAADTYRASLLLRAVMPVLHRRAARLTAEIARFSELEAEAAREQRDLLAERNGLRENRDNLRRLLAAKATAERRTVAARESESKRLDALAARATSLKALIEKINAEERRERELNQPNTAETAAEIATKKAEARLAALPPLEQPMPGGWVRRPAEGRLISQFGAKNSLGVVANGDTIATIPDALVVAPRAGRVVFAGPFRGYGLLLIIKQAEGYHLLMAGFARIDASVGQWLVAGEPVGQMGQNANGKSRLYVELRRNNVSVDPLPWLMAGKRKVSG